MVRLIKRYGSRKLYDTEESRYVSLEELAGWIRKGQQIQVIDNKTSDDVTVQTLGQIISEEGRRGTTLFPSELLHDLIRSGENALSERVGQIQSGVGKLLQASVDRISPVRRVREETMQLRRRLEQLERSLMHMEEGGAPSDSSDPESESARKVEVRFETPAQGRQNEE